MYVYNVYSYICVYKDDVYYDSLEFFSSLSASPSA